MRDASNLSSRSAAPGRVAAFLFALMVSLALVQPAAANPRYAAIVVDANTGETLFARNADDQRFPASLTKMMTLYMVFEALQAGRINLNTRVPFSAQAAARPPTKLGVRAGNAITVEQAILSLVTKSANDAAAAVGELLAGSEENFGRVMTAKARSLGMSGTTFRNASGLPNSAQQTTARDMARLGIALREHFPQYYHYFSTRSFTFGGTRMGNHNRVLGRMKGVDGIKTGFIRASGFNLVSSVSDGNRRVVAVVMGGRTARTRDDHMVELLRTHVPRASNRRGGQLVARTATAPVAAYAAAMLPQRNIPVPDSRPADPFEAVTASVAPQVALPLTRETPAPAPTPPVAVAAVDPVATSSTSGGWAIQVASVGSEAEARDVLAKTTAAAPSVLSSLSPFTERFQKGGVLYFRARYAGLGSKDAAWNACGALKKSNIDCYAIEQ